LYRWCRVGPSQILGRYRLAACVIAGRRKAAAKGTKGGNPIGRLRTETEKAIQRLLRTGTGITKTEATVGVGTATVQRIQAELGGPLSGGEAAA
jgi:DNA invertase Pin-like site-specific DNA recombinase